MKLTIERNLLLKSLSHVRSIVERKTTIPILSNMVLAASAEFGLQLRATDLEREVMETVSANVTADGGTTVSAHTLYDIANKLPKGAEIEISLNTERERLTITCGRSRFELATLPAEDFPDLSPGDLSHSFQVGAGDFKRLLEKTEFAMSDEVTRYYLCGTFLHQASRGDEPMLRVTSTDGHRLAQAEVPLPTGANGMPGVILPRKTVHELQRLLDDTDSKVEVSVSRAKARFQIGGITLTTKLVDGTFPDYQRVIPKGNDKLLKIPSGDFVAAIDRVSTIQSERGRAIKLSLGSPDKLALSVNNPEGGHADEELAADYFPAPSSTTNAGPMEIGFNATYLLDIAKQIEAEAAEILLADPGSPVVVKDESDAGLLYVLMPMRV